MIQITCNCKTNCTSVAVISSIVVGVLAAIFRYTALVTITPAFLWVLFGISVGYLAITLLTSAASERSGCCGTFTSFFVGVLGTIVTSLLLLGITFAATSVLGAIITGALLFFFSLFIASTACMIRCNNRCG